MESLRLSLRAWCRPYAVAASSAKGPGWSGAAAQASRRFRRSTQALGQSPQVPDAAVAHALKAMPDARRLLLIVDQFEETFTFAAPEDNEPFQTVLQRLAEVPGAFVVLTARADFYDKLMAPPRVLWEQIRTHRVEVLSLDNKRLAQAIVEPARVRGVYIDPLLVQRLLADAALEPGVLPLVQETMVLMWERLERRYLSLRDYESLVPPRDRIEENGGLPHTGLQAAIERHAGLVVGGMPEPQRVIARRVFLRLIEFGQGRSDVRRQLHLEELRSRDDDPREFESTLRTLDENRLLTFSGDETSGRLVDIAHETLIASWPELRRWIATRREAELKRRRLRARATDWDALKRAGGLLDAQVLPEAEHWRDGPDAAELGVDALVADFIRASREVIDRDAREKEGVRERELKAAQDLANERELTIRAQRKAMENAAEILIESGSTALLHGNSLDAMHLFASAIETMPGSSLDQVTMRQCLGFLVREVPRVDAIVEHTERVNSAAFSPEGSRIVTASGDKTARVWGADSGALLAELKGHTNAVVSGAFSPDGTSIVTASGDKTARVWNAVDGKLIAELKGHTGPVNSAAFSPDGTQIVTASADQTARVWNAADGKLIAELKGHVNWVNSAAFSPDGTRVVTASTDQTARIWNAADGKPIAELNEHTGDVYSAAFSPDGTRVVTASDDDTARVWNAADGALIAELKGHVNWVNSAAFSPDGTRVVTASTDQTARIWNAADGALIAELEGHTGPVNSAAFSPDGTRVVTASADQTARVWNATDGKLIAELIGHTDTVDSAAFSPDGTQIVTASDDDTARVWNAADGSRNAELIKGDTYKVWSAAFSPDGTRVVTASDDDTARVWNAAGGKPIVELKGHADPVYSAAFSFDGTRIVTASHDKTARVWNAADGSLIAKLEGHTDQVWSAAFSPDGTRVVTASHDKTARVWNAADGAPIVELGHADQVWSAAFSPDGTQIVTASSDREARVWNAADGAAYRQTQGTCKLGILRRVQSRRHPGRHRLSRSDGAGLERGRRRAYRQTQRTYGLGELRRVQPRWHPNRHRFNRSDGAGLERGRWRVHRRTQGTYGLGELRHVQPRRHPRPHRLLGYDGTGLEIRCHLRRCLDLITLDRGADGDGAKRRWGPASLTRRMESTKNRSAGPTRQGSP